MKQVTLRLDDDLARDLAGEAAARGQSVNAFAAGVLSAAVDPDAAGDEAERVRARLARAGLLADPAPASGRRPDPDLLARARRRAGTGRPLAEFVAEGRR